MNFWTRMMGGGDEAAVQLLERSRKGRDILDAMEAEAVLDRLDTRQALAAERAEVQAALEVRYHAYTPQLLAAAEQVTQARAALQAAIDAAGALQGAFRAGNLADDHTIAVVERQLRDTASPLLAAFVDEMAVALRETGESADKSSKGNGFGYAVEWDNRASVARRVDAIIAASRAAEALAIEALTDEQVAERLEGLRSGLPVVETCPDEFRVTH